MAASLVQSLFVYNGVRWQASPIPSAIVEISNSPLFDYKILYIILDKITKWGQR